MAKKEKEVIVEKEEVAESVTESTTQKKTVTRGLPELKVNQKFPGKPR